MLSWTSAPFTQTDGAELEQDLSGDRCLPSWTWRALDSCVPWTIAPIVEIRKSVGSRIEQETTATSVVSLAEMRRLVNSAMVALGVNSEDFQQCVCHEHGNWCTLECRTTGNRVDTTHREKGVHIQV